MRKLNKKQKQLLDKLYSENRFAINCMLSVDELDETIWDELIRLNDHETLWHNVSRYVTDLKIKDAMKIQK